MMKWALLVFLILMMLFSHNKSPISQALLLIGLSVWLGFMMGLSSSLWLFALIVLIFSSGMMVVFLYLTSLSAQDTIKTHYSSIFLALSISAGVLFMNNVTPHNTDMTLITTSNYSAINHFIILMLCIYLLVTILCVFKYSQSFKGSLLISKFI